MLLLSAALEAFAGARPRSVHAARRFLRASRPVCLNRLLLEPHECVVTDGRLTAQLDPADPRAVHVRDVLRAVDGDAVRAGVLDAGATDTATTHWTGPPCDGQSLRIDLGDAEALLSPVRDEQRPRVDLLLSMPRPPAFARLLPHIASLGVGTIWLTCAAKCERSYFSSHLLRAGNEAELRRALVSGLEQVRRSVAASTLSRHWALRLYFAAAVPFPICTL